MDNLSNISFVFSLITIVLYFVGYILSKEKLQKFSIFTIFISAFLLFVYIILYLLKAKRFILTNQFETVLLMLELIYIINFYFYFKLSKNINILFPTVIISPAFLGILNLIDKDIKPLMPALKSNWLIFHVLSSMISYSFFAIAGIYGMVFFILKNMQKFDEYIHKAIKVGFVFLTIGIITGAIWAESAWGRYWSWDPKETWSLITWFFYAVILHLKRKGISEKTFALLLFFGFLFVIFTYFGVNYLLGGLHSYAR
jgi:ABC-type transport system involved in cytochrome c biogenesis permease subunit